MQIFGPVQSIIKFKDMEEIIARANDTKYGLAAAIFTEDIDIALTFSSRVKAGTVWYAIFVLINTFPQRVRGFNFSFFSYLNIGILKLYRDSGAREISMKLKWVCIISV